MDEELAFFLDTWRGWIVAQGEVDRRVERKVLPYTSYLLEEMPALSMVARLFNVQVSKRSRIDASATL